MPQIIVTCDRPTDHEQGSVMLRERVNVTDFESERFAANLVERLGWAVCDAAEAEESESPVSSDVSEPSDKAEQLQHSEPADRSRNLVPAAV